MNGSLEPTAAYAMCEYYTVSPIADLPMTYGSPWRLQLELGQLISGLVSLCKLRGQMPSKALTTL
jgi:hypothetical protein